MLKHLDNYTIQARVAPVLIVLLPALLWFLAAFPPDSTAMGLVATLLAFSGLGTLLGQLGRDRGVKLERGLWKEWEAEAVEDEDEKKKIMAGEWGTPPTTRYFRFNRGLCRSRKTLEGMHANMRYLVEGSEAITAESETSNPRGADDQYRRWTSYLRELTRDPEQYPVVNGENINYGFRRNLYGLRWFGAAIAGVVLALLALPLLPQGWPPVRSLISLFGLDSITSPLDRLTWVASFVLLIFFIFRVTPKWVRPPAYAYADRLIRASDKLAKEKRASEKA